MMTSESNRAGRAVKCLIVAIPLWLALSGGIGLWLHFRQQATEHQQQEHAYRKDIDAQSLADDFTKIVDVLGPRNDRTDTARKSLLRVASMIEGAMGVNNIGYEVTRAIGQDSKGIAAPLLMADVLRRKTDNEIWLIVPYDSPSDLPRGQASASSVAVSLAVAQSLVGSKVDHNIRFLFAPMVHADREQRLEVAAQVKRLIELRGSPRVVLVVGSMLHEGRLSLVSNQPSSAAVVAMQDQLSVIAAAGTCFEDDSEFSSLLAARDLPAALLVKAPQMPMTAMQEDGMLPGNNTLVASARDVVSLLLRLAGDSQKK
ncbi:MAG: hypothetical protein RI957_1614 [Verrucomicrobiota bacterium]|jgi:hypothetical protein